MNNEELMAELMEIKNQNNLNMDQKIKIIVALLIIDSLVDIHIAIRQK